MGCVRTDLPYNNLLVNYFSSAWGRWGTRTGLRAALTPRRVRGNVLITAARAGLCVLVALVFLKLVGRMDLAPYAAMGCFTALYARDDTYRRRVWVLALVGAGLTMAVGAGALASALSETMWAPIVVVASVAAAAKLFSDTVNLGAPAGLMFVFAAGVAAYAPQSLDAVVANALTTAAAAALCWALALVGAFVHPRAGERLAVARALHAVADHIQDPSPERAQGAEQALRRAWQVLHDAPEHGAVHTLEVLTSRAQVLLAHRQGPDESGAAELRRLARRVRARRRVDPALSAAEHAVLRTYADQVRAVAGNEGVMGPRLVWAGRIALASVMAGVSAWALGLGHGYWATVSAASVLQATNVTTTWQRTVQRAGGTVVGVVVAVLLFAVVDTTQVWAVIALVVLCQVGAELVVMTNYAYAIVFVTPLTLALSSLAHPGVGTFDLAGERLAGTVLGALVGLVAALVVLDRGAGRRLERAVVECEALCARLEGECLDAGARHRLVGALGRVREARAAMGARPVRSGVLERADRVCERAGLLSAGWVPVQGEGTGGRG